MLFDKGLWMAMAAKLEEIADKTSDLNTQGELEELIEKIYQSV